MMKKWIIFLSILFLISTASANTQTIQCVISSSGMITCPQTTIPGATTATLTVVYTTPVTTRPVEYMNPNATFVPMLNQGELPWCSAYSLANAYDVTHGVVQEYPYNITEVYNTFMILNEGNKLDITDLGRTATRYGFSGYYELIGNNSVKWDKIKERTFKYGTSIIFIKTYANQYDGSQINFLYPEPIGKNTNWHSVSVVGYDDTKDEIYFLDSRNSSISSGYHIRGITKNYWLSSGVGAIVPY
jgi:hypothetical protein